MKQDEMDRKKILAQVEVANGIEGDLKLARVEGMLDVNDILTEKQRKKLEEERRKIGGMGDNDPHRMDRMGGGRERPMK